MGIGSINVCNSLVVVVMTLFDFMDKNPIYFLVILFISFRGLFWLIHGDEK